MAELATIYPDFQDALLLAIETALTSAPVSLGWPTGGLQSDHVWISGAGTVTPSWGVSGMQTRDEKLTAEVRIIADYTTSDYATARDRAFEIEAEVEGAVSTDPTLGGVVRFAAVTEIVVDEAIPDDRTRQVGIRLTVTAEASVS